MLAHPPYQASDKKMIDEEATFEKFRYYARDLKPKSGKRIIAVCDECGKVRDARKGAYTVLCRSCSLKGDRHPMFGKHPSAESIRKSAVSRKGRHHTEETKKKLSDARKGKNNPAWKGGIVTKICLTCGKDFITQKSEIARGRGKYCSLMCLGKAHRGENASNWKGGVSYEPYCSKWNDEFREYIRNKFDRKCFLCGKTEAKNSGRKLSVHHVNGNKQCGCAETEEDRIIDNKSCQFVPLCISCHTKTNYNREYWETLIKNKLRNNLNGWYI